MPELPEVETIRNLLRLGSDFQPGILGKRIIDGRVYWERTLITPTLVEFVQRVGNQRIVEIDRRGKYLIFNLSADFLLIHLRMSGDLLVETGSNSPRAHTRLILDLEDNIHLTFVDPRKFGRIWLVSDPQSVLAPLGPEPFGPEINGQNFYQRLQTSKRRLKPLLLDQSFMAGLGNIYVDEALHHAKLHPLKHSNDVTLQQAELLLESIQLVLLEAIQRNGSSIDWVYRGGDFQNYFRVYHRTGEPCRVCGTPIVRLIIGQRGTHYCPRCQPLN